jgi:MMP 1-O-methyltransferase
VDNRTLGEMELVDKCISEVNQTVANVKGLLNEGEGAYLYLQARVGAKLGCIVEIGSWQGKSTIWLAKASQAVGGERVYAIDPHPPGGNREHAFRANIKRAGVDSMVLPIVKTSLQALRSWDRPVGLLWIDADHKYDSVRSDFYGWYSHVVNGGIIALHDTLSEKGVKKFVSDHIDRLVKQNKLSVIGQFDEILAVKKLRPLSAFQSAMRLLILCVEFPRRNHILARDASILGKNCLRAGNYQKAREYFCLAASYQLFYWRNLRRLLFSYLIGLRRLYRVNRRNET